MQPQLIIIFHEVERMDLCTLTVQFNIKQRHCTVYYGFALSLPGFQTNIYRQTTSPTTVILHFNLFCTGFDKLDGNDKRDEKDKSQTTVIVVSVVVVAFVIGVLVLFAYIGTKTGRGIPLV